MNYLIENPVGIDTKINRIQGKIYDPLCLKWGSLDCYGRVYKKSKQDGISLERYSGNGEYEPVLFSEGNKIFFVQGKKPDLNFGRATNLLWIVAIVNIDEIINVKHRADEEIHQELVTELANAIPIKQIVGLEYGMDSLATVVEDQFDVGNFKYSDVHPYHVFMIKTEVTYNLIENNC